MSSDIKVYKVKDFIRLNESGEIDFDRSIQMVRDLAVAASFYAGHNILVDLRETTIVGESNMGLVLQVALEMARYESAFKGKIANVVPDDEKRLSLAKQFEASLHLQGFDYRVFTSFEAAIDWLSEVTQVKGD
jgi:hypothetical protein